MSVACQFCYGTASMTRVLSLGYMPPPNEMQTKYDPKPQTWLPTEMWFCSNCELAQLGCIPDQNVAFPEDYPYTSGATPALRKNFEDLANKCVFDYDVGPEDLVVDIGSNDGTLLSCFPTGQNVLGVEPTAAAHIATKNGIRTEKRFFNKHVAATLRDKYGQAKLITCANCFAHMPDIHGVVEGIGTLLADDGVFVSESHYLIDLITTLQYDTIYAEHQRYYTIRSLERLFAFHNLQIVSVERIPTHGGSIRVYAMKSAVAGTPRTLIEMPDFELAQKLERFAGEVQFKRTAVWSYINQIKNGGGRIAGIGAPSRGSTVISYLRLDQSIVEYIAEQPHSLKVGRYMPGTDIPVVDEERLYKDPPDAAILFSWHLADTLIPKIRAKGYHGPIVLPCSATIVNEPALVEVA